MNNKYGCVMADKNNSSGASQPSFRFKVTKKWDRLTESTIKETKVFQITIGRREASIGRDFDDPYKIFSGTNPHSIWKEFVSTAATLPHSIIHLQESYTLKPIIPPDPKRVIELMTVTLLPRILLKRDSIHTDILHEIPAWMVVNYQDDKMITCGENFPDAMEKLKEYVFKSMNLDALFPSLSSWK